MLLVVLPCANIFVAVSVDIGALAVLLTSLEVTLVVVLVSESELSLALEQVVLKLTLISLLRLCKVLHT